MKHPPIKIKTLLLIIIIVTTTAIISSCETKIDIIPKSDFLSLPSHAGKGIVTTLSDSGLVQLVMFSPLMEKYENTDLPFYEFRAGIKVFFYDGKNEPAASVTAKYAKLIESSNLWELKDSVVVLNENNDKLETEVLFWNQAKDLIYTDRFVKITNKDQIIQGFGFESDSRLQKRKIKKVSATIYLHDEE